jgi:hypothetical protein
MALAALQLGADFNQFPATDWAAGAARFKPLRDISICRLRG